MPRTSDDPDPPGCGVELQPVERTYVRFNERKFIYFGGCDYLRLSSHPVVLAAVRSGLARYGLNVSASRRTTGNHALYRELEEQLARFFGVERACLTPTGYLANLVALQGLADRFSHAFIDARAHPSLMDAAAALSCPLVRFRHRDAAHLARELRKAGRRARVIVLTDGLFAHDGSVAPLRDYLELLPANGWLLVDDAHAAGVLGPRGQGTADYLGMNASRLIQTITLSKAFGVYGGAVLGRGARLAVANRAFVGSTPLPLPLAAGALAALRLVASDSTLRARLEANTSYVKNAVSAVELAVWRNPVPILAWTPPSARAARALTRRLLERGVYPTLIRYPGGPAQGYFRFALSSEHTRAQLDRLIESLRQCADVG